MIRWPIVILAVLGFLGCENHEIPKKVENIIQKTDISDSILHIAYSGELLGELEPCGCSGSKLGGMLLRSGWIQNLKTEHPNVILIDGGFASRKWELQDQMKFRVHNQVLQSLGYQFQFLGQKEYLPTELSQSSLFIGGKKTWYKTHKVGNNITILFLTIEIEKKPDIVELTALIKNTNPQLIWIMTKGIFDGYQTLIPDGNYLTIVWPVDSQAPFSPSKIASNIFLVSAGNRGRYTGLMQIKFPTGNNISWENCIENKIIALEAKYPPHPEVLKHLDQYKQDLKDKQLLALQIKRSSPIGFVGSDICKSCHITEYTIWSGYSHAKAFATLVKEKHDYDPECVGCHTVGFEFEEGFRTEEETPSLINVGCESCHGPGVQHVMKPDKNYGKTNGASTCLVCHEKDRSPHFDYDKFMQKIKHWK